MQNGEKGMQETLKINTSGHDPGIVVCVSGVSAGKRFLLVGTVFSSGLGNWRRIISQIKANAPD